MSFIEEESWSVGAAWSEKKKQDEKNEDEMGRKWAIKCEKLFNGYPYRFSVDHITISMQQRREWAREKVKVNEMNKDSEKNGGKTWLEFRRSVRIVNYFVVHLWHSSFVFMDV